MGVSHADLRGFFVHPFHESLHTAGFQHGDGIGRVVARTDHQSVKQVELAHLFSGRNGHQRTVCRNVRRLLWDGDDVLQTAAFQGHHQRQDFGGAGRIATLPAGRLEQHFAAGTVHQYAALRKKINPVQRIGPGEVVILRGLPAIGGQVDVQQADGVRVGQTVRLPLENAPALRLCLKLCDGGFRGRAERSVRHFIEKTKVDQPVLQRPDPLTPAACAQGGKQRVVAFVKQKLYCLSSGHAVLRQAVSAKLRQQPLGFRDGGGGLLTVNTVRLAAQQAQFDQSALQLRDRRAGITGLAGLGSQRPGG